MALPGLGGGAGAYFRATGPQGHRAAGCGWVYFKAAQEERAGYHTDRVVDDPGHDRVCMNSGAEALVSALLLILSAEARRPSSVSRFDSTGQSSRYSSMTNSVKAEYSHRNVPAQPGVLWAATQAFSKSGIPTPFAPMRCKLLTRLKIVSNEYSNAEVF